MTATTTDLSAVASQPVEGKRVRVIPDPDGGSNPSYSIDSLTEPKNGTIKLWEPAPYGVFGKGASIVTFEEENQSWYVPNRSIQPYNEPGLLIVTEDEGYSAILVISKTVAWHLARRPDGGYRTAVSFNPGEVYTGRWTDLRYLTREGLQALASEIGLHTWEYDVSQIPSGLVSDEHRAQDEAVPPTRTAEEIRLAEEVARLNDVVRVERARAYAAESKIEEITDRLIEEANIRGWCSEYDDIAEELGLRPRTKEYVVTTRVLVEVEVTVDATDEDAAQVQGEREAEEMVEAALSGTYDIEVRGIDEHSTNVSEN